MVQQSVVPGEGDALLLEGIPQLAQHDGGDSLEVVLGQLVEVDDLVHPVDELRPQEGLQSLHGPLPPLLVGGAAEAHAAGGGTGVAARVGGHDDNGVLEVHVAALGVGDVAVVQDLEQNVEHIGVGLLDLVEENNAVGLSAHLLGELARLVIAHIARGGADDAADGKLLHKLRHIQPDEGLGRVEHIHGQPLDQLGLAHAGGAHKDEGHRLALGGDAHPATANGGGHGVDRLVLADEVLAQPVLQLGQPLVLGLLDLAGGDLGPQLDDPGQMGHRQGRGALGVQLAQLVLELDLPALDGGQPLVILAAALIGHHLLPLGGQVVQFLAEVGLTALVGPQGLGGGGVAHEGVVLGSELVQLPADLALAALVVLEGGLALVVPVVGLHHQVLPLLTQLLQLLLHLYLTGQSLVVEVHVGAGLVDEVDGLVRQEPVGDIPLAHGHRQAAHLRRDGDKVVLLVVGGDPLEDLHAVLDGGLLHHHRLEPPLQGGVLLDVLAVLGEGGGADNLDLTPAQGGLEDVGGIHGPLGVAGAHDIVDLVDDQDDVAQLLDLLNEALHAAFKLAPELGARHQGGEVQQIDLLVQQLVGYVPLPDLLGQALGDGGLAHAGLADEAGVVLLTAVEDLDGALDLLVPADDLVQLALGGLLGQGDAVVLQKLPLGGLVALLVLVGALVPAVVPLGRLVLGVLGPAAEQLVQEGEGGRLALVLLILLAVVTGHQALHALGSPEGGHHLIGQSLQVLVGDAHFLHHIFHGLDAHFLGALEAQPLTLGRAALHLLNEDDGYILVTSGTKCGLHICSAPLAGRTRTGPLPGEMILIRNYELGMNQAGFLSPMALQY